MARNIRSIRGVAALGIMLVSISFSRRASASPAFTDVLAEALALSKPPECTVCHTTSTGGFGTANQPFATYLRSRGLKAANPDSLRTAVAAMKGENHDTDGDGIPDLQALQSGNDPNGKADTSTPPPAYGCGAEVVPVRRTGEGTLVGTLVAVAACVVARRRGRVLR